MDPWGELEKEILGVLEDGVRDFAEETKGEIGDFLKKKAKQIAEQKWISINAVTPEARSMAKSNLGHLRAQVKGEVARLHLAATQQAQDLLSSVLGVTLEFVRRIAPSLLGGA